MPIDSPRAPLRIVIFGGVIALLLGLAYCARGRRTPRLSESETDPASALQLLIRVEEAEAAKYWKPELEARPRARKVERLWDELNRSTNKLAAFAARFSPGEIRLPVFERPAAAPHGIQIYAPGNSRLASASDWRKILSQIQNAGWQLDRCEFRFIAISPDTFYVSAHLSNARTGERAILEGTITANLGGPGFASVNAAKLELRTRRGPPPFREMFYAEVRPPSGSYFIDPLILRDLDSDGQLEVILAAANLAFRRAPDGDWISTPFCPSAPALIFTGMLGDFSGDGRDDFLCATFEGLALLEGTQNGGFSSSPRNVWTAQPRLRYAQCMTAGDFDRDGDLDLFLGQYKLPYNQGQMPFPYFDANDGHPSFLLRNDGHGTFSDITPQAGLAAKRGRRIYSASFIDLDSDTDLDLLTVSDFAGLDAYENDGRGNFTDATRKWFTETRAFGMAHSFSDFNRDGLLDILMVGMNSPTADRLASLRLDRPYEKSDAGMRAAVTFGNRLYFGQRDGTFRQNEISAQVARTGWSWGSAAGDLDNDGFPELYIANGHDTQASVQEYEPEFWLHDLYIGNSRENSLAHAYFREKSARTRGRGHSYGGYEKNRLFLNQGGTNFIEAAHLFGVGMQQDSRNVAMQDLDRDGKLDLIVTTFEAYPQTKQTIRFFRNELEPVGTSIRLELADPVRVGATAKVVATRTNAVAIVAGESYRTQLPPAAHLGIGTNHPSTIQIHPATNLFHPVQ